jgi:DNA-binding NarL/FixJ family response regulator
MEEQTKAALDAGAQVVLSKSTPRNELICALRKLRPARR